MRRCFQFLSAIFILWNLLQDAHSIMEESYHLDLNDILNDQLMPANLFLQNTPFVKGTNLSRKQFYGNVSADADIDGALVTMKYHRKMMNEYMASNFIAQQIISDLSMNPVRMQRRLGTAIDTDENLMKLENASNRVKVSVSKPNDGLLYDTGSIGYQQWLEKTTTLDDIHRQFATSLNSSSTPISDAITSLKKNPKKLEFNKRQGTDENDTGSEETDDVEDENEYEEGDITGYIYAKPNTPSSPVQSNIRYPTSTGTGTGFGNAQHNYGRPSGLNYNNYNYNTPETATGSGTTSYGVGTTGYGNGYRNFGTVAPTARSKNVKFYQSSVSSLTTGKNLKDPKKRPFHQPSNYNPSKSAENMNQNPKVSEGYYHPTAQETYEHEDHSYQVENSNHKKEIGLKDVLDIALTTLAFLSFGMFILQVLMCITMNNNYNYNNSMMMMMPMEGGEAEAAEGIEEIRRKRRSIEFDRVQKVNELSRRVLLSINALTSAPKDNSKCLQKILCQNNYFARQQKDGQKIWMPVWSLGISWLAKTKNLALQSLRATAIGLGGGNCQSFSGC